MNKVKKMLMHGLTVVGQAYAFKVFISVGYIMKHIDHSALRYFYGSKNTLVWSKALNVRGVGRIQHMPASYQRQIETLKDRLGNNQTRSGWNIMGITNCRCIFVRMRK